MAQRIRPASGSKRKDYTLIVVVVGVVVLLIAAAMIWPRVIEQSGGPPSMAAKATRDLLVLAAALDLFSEDVGRYPTAEEGLQAVMDGPVGGEDWRGPYLPDGVPLDPWGNAYILEFVDGEYFLRCLGADGVEGGEGIDADIEIARDLEAP